MTPHEESQPSAECVASFIEFAMKRASHTLPSCRLIIAKCNGFASEKCSREQNVLASDPFRCTASRCRAHSQNVSSQILRNLCAEHANLIRSLAEVTCASSRLLSR